MPHILYNNEHRELYSNIGMRIDYTIFLMLRLKFFRPEVFEVGSHFEIIFTFGIVLYQSMASSRTFQKTT
jgi:hypothetical protein